MVLAFDVGQRLNQLDKFLDAARLKLGGCLQGEDSGASSERYALHADLK